MNERVLKLRKELNLTQEEMGISLGVTRAAISKIESGDRNLTEQMIIAISRTYDVNTNWLRYGQGEMFIESDEISLDEYAKKNQISAYETEIIKGYLSLEPEVRNKFMEVLRSAAKATEDKRVLSVVKDETADFGKPVAAHNDSPLTEEEMRLMRKDLDKLKR